MSDILIIFLSLCAFLIVFPLFWCGVIGIVSLGGWRQLACDYPGVQASSATDWNHMCTARLGPILGLGLYRSSLSFGKDTSHIHITPLFFFRPFHPPVSIPLSEIHRSGTASGPFSSVRLTFQNSAIPMRVSGKLADWILGA